MIDYINLVLNDTDKKVTFLLSALSFLLVFDFIVGTVVAKLKKETKFSSYKMKTGLLIKISEITLCVVALPFALMVDGGYQLIVVGYVGLCVAEVYSILGNLQLVDDDKNNVKYLEKFLFGIFKKGDK